MARGDSFLRLRVPLLSVVLDLYGKKVKNDCGFFYKN